MDIQLPCGGALEILSTPTLRNHLRIAFEALHQHKQELVFKDMGLIHSTAKWLKSHRAMLKRSAMH